MHPFESMEFPFWEVGWFAPLVGIVVLFLAVGFVSTLAMNHVVLWWARRQAKGLWGARVAGLFAVGFSVGGVWGRLASLGEPFGLLSLLWVGLLAAGAAILVFSFEPATRGVFHGEPVRPVETADPEAGVTFEPAGEGP